MATGHSFAVLASHSVHQPVNPKTGLTVTQYDRKSTSENTNGNENKDERLANVSAPVVISGGPDSVTGSQEMDDGTNFYDKLLELKEAHQKTLVMWEKLYKEQNTDSEDPVSNTINRSRLASLENLLNSDVHGGAHEPRNVHTKDLVRDMSSMQSTSAYLPNSSKREQSESEPVKSDNPVYSYHSSMSDDFADCDADDGEQSTEESSSQGHIDTRHSAMARIEDMWEKFSVDSYCPRSGLKEKPASASARNSSNRAMTRMPHKKPVTVPKPFSMSSRDAHRVPKKSKAALELEQQENDKKKMEDLECQKKFKAMPVPAHVHLRLYDELKEARETRRREITHQRQEILQSIQEPFQFSLRDEEKQKAKRSTAARHSSHQFRAHPFPSRIFADVASEKMLEEEEYRKIRKKMRAKELLRSSSLPPTMRLKGKDYTDGRQRREEFEARAQKAGLTNESKFQPRINSTMPDFDKQYERFMHEMSQRKHMREATVCKPFNLRTSTQSFARSRSAKLSRSYADMSEDDDSCSGKQQMSRPSSRNMSASTSFAESYSSFDVIPSKTTRASAVRMSANRTRVEKGRDKEVEERRIQEERQNRGQQLKKTIAEKSPNMDRTWLQEEIRKKLQEKKKAERQRTASYQHDLKEIRQRVNQRPLLFEQVAQRNAAQSADRKYMETLKKSGIDYEHLQQSSLEGSRPADSIADNASEYSPDEGSRSAGQSPDRSSRGDRSPDRESTGRESPSYRSRQTGSEAASPSPPDYTEEYEDNSITEELEVELA